MLYRDPPVLPGHAADRPRQEVQLRVPGEGGRPPQVPAQERHQHQQAEAAAEADPAALQEVRGHGGRGVRVQLLRDPGDGVPVRPGAIQMRPGGKKFYHLVLIYILTKEMYYIRFKLMNYM